ncbi:MAG: NAD(P)-dependent alcohol dehydrogenase [Ornithinimicrobium sp.]
MTTREDADVRSVACPRYGGPDVLELRDVPIPVPTDGEVLVRVHAAGLNAADWHVMRADPAIVRLGQGLRRPKIKALGSDIAGTVHTLGRGVHGLAVADEVLGELSASGCGAFAEYVCVPQKFIAAKPVHLSFEEAAVLPVSGITALQALRDQAMLRAGETVLVHGASGGVGPYAVQLAVAMGGQVTAVCSAAKIDGIRALGAAEVVDYGVDDVFAGGRQWDVILGVNGFQALTRYRDALKPGGRYLMIGGTGKQMFQGIVSGRFRSRGGRTLGYVVATPDAEKLATVAGYAHSGQLRPHIDRTFALEEYEEAMRYLEDGHSHGKSVFSIYGGDS